MGWSVCLLVLQTSAQVSCKLWFPSRYYHFFHHIFIVTIVCTKLCLSLTSTCFNLSVCRMPPSFSFIFWSASSLLSISLIFPSLLLFPFLLCLFPLKFQSFEELSYSKILINWKRIYVYILHLLFCLFSPWIFIYQAW